MALNNCSISSNGTASIAGGAPVGVKVIQMVISPDANYVVAADKFKAGNGNPTSPRTFERDVNGVSFDQTGTDNDLAIKKVYFKDSTTAGAENNTVLVDITLEEDYVMPSSNTGLTIDIDGDAAAKNTARTLTLNIIEPSGLAQAITETFVGTESGTNFGVTEGSTQADTPTTGKQKTAYTVAGTSTGNNKIVLVKKYTANTNNFYSFDPYHTGVASNKNFNITNTLTESGGETTASEFEIKYDMPASNDSVDLEFFTTLEGTAASQAKKINDYIISTSKITTAGEIRKIRIFGISGAKFDLTISDGSKTYDFTTDTFTASATLLDDAEIGTQFSGGKGYYWHNIHFPANATSSEITYTFTIAAGTGTTLDGGLGTNPFTITQKGIVTTTYNVTEAITWTPTSLGSAVTKTGPSAGLDTVPAFDMSFAITDDATFYLRRQPLASDFTNTTANSISQVIGDVTTDKSTNHGTGSAGMTALTITVTGTTIFQNPTADTTCSLNLDSVVNQAPVAVDHTYTTNEDTTLNIDLSAKASDPNSDSLTYSIVADNSSSNGTLTLTDASAGTVTYVPAANNNTNTSFTWRVTDGYEFSNTATATVNVTAVNDAPTDIALSANTQAENTAINTIIGAFSTTDVDAGDSFTYTLESGTGDTDNSSFNISGANLRNSAVFDYETKNSYSIRVRSTDSGGAYFEKQFTITVTDVSESVARWELTVYLANGSVSGIHYADASQYCNGGSLAAMPGGCFQVNHWVRYATVAGGCGSSYGRAKITDLSASAGVPTAYVHGAKHYSSSNDSENDTGGTNC